MSDLPWNEALEIAQDSIIKLQAENKMMRETLKKIAYWREATFAEYSIEEVGNLALDTLNQLTTLVDK